MFGQCWSGGAGGECIGGGACALQSWGNFAGRHAVAPTTPVDSATKAGPGPLMKYFDEAALHLAVNERRTTAFLAVLAAILAIPHSASAQTAFTPSPPFDVPMLPSPSGNWTVMVGIGGRDARAMKWGKKSTAPMFP